MSIVEPSAVGVASAAPSPDPAPPGGGRGSDDGRPAGGGRDYSEVVDHETLVDLFRGSEALRHALRSVGLSRPDAARRAGKGRDRIDALLHMSEAMRVTPITLRLLCDQWGLDRDVVEFLRATCPKMFAPESEE